MCSGGEDKAKTGSRKTGKRVIQKGVSGISLNKGLLIIGTINKDQRFEGGVGICREELNN